MIDYPTGSEQIDAALDSMQEVSGALRKILPPTGEDGFFEHAPLWAQRTIEVERVLGEWRRALEVAAMEETGGERLESGGFEISSEPVYSWLVNAPKVFSDVARWTETSFAEVLRVLQDHDALELRWKISKLREAFRLIGLQLDEKKKGSPEDVLDLDGVHAARVEVRRRTNRGEVDG